MKTKQDVAVIKQLKLETINKFEYFLNKLFKGYKEDYSDIMDTICLINLYFELKNNSIYYATKYI